MIVSNLFIDIYQNFNVSDQILKMMQLSRKELMLLLILSSESFEELNDAALKNFDPYKSELEIIYGSLPDVSEDNPYTNDADLILLSKQTSDRFIDTSVLTDVFGNLLPKPLSNEEALIRRREMGIDDIINQDLTCNICIFVKTV